MRNDCTRAVMNTLLDKRLLQLKKINKNQFKKEMYLQEVFNNTIKAHCDTDKCRKHGGTVWGLTHSSCMNNAYEYRTLQAELINVNRLSFGELLPDKRSTKAKDKNMGSFKKYVKILCSMPDKVWDDNRAPDNCEDKALTELKEMYFTDDVCDLS